MAKKKVSHVLKQTNGEEARGKLEREIEHQSSAAAMDVSAENERLQNLKFLNNVLVKETSDCRKKVEALAMEKVALEAELSRDGKEKEAMKIELIDVNEQSVGLELEKCVVCDFMEAQIGEIRAGLGELMREKIEIQEMKREREVENSVLSRKVDDLQGTLENERAEARKVVCERDAAKRELNDVAERAEELRTKLNEMENTERMLIEEVEKLRLHCRTVEAEDEEHLTVINEMKREIDLVKRKLKESEEMIADLQNKIEEIVKEKEEIWVEKDGLEVKIEDLERDVKQLNAGVFNLTGEKKMLASKILELGKILYEASEKETAMVREIKKMAEELKEKKESILVVLDEKDSVERDLNLTREESKVLAEKIEILIREKTEIEEEKVKGERTIVGLQREVDELKDSLLTLEDKCRVEEEKMKKLISEVSHLSNALDRITLERENTEKDLTVERMKAEKIRFELLGMEKRVEETERELKKRKIEKEDQLKFQNGMKTRIEGLEMDKGSEEKKLCEAHIIMEDLKAKIKSAGMESERALAMVKKTVKFLCDSKGNEEEEVEEEIIPYVAELNAIKTAFKNKEKMVEEMRIKLEEEGAKRQKRRRFFTLLTTATTFLAAISAVYVTKGR